MTWPVVHRPLGAIIQTEIRFNLKRVAPYALMVIFAANAVLWWAAGPAPSRGVATNSEAFIVGVFGVFSFMTLPVFTALMMGDPVIRDFDLGLDPLLFSKPLRRVEYLLGKLVGNFLVLVCCQACFALTLLLLQAFSVSGMLVLSPRFVPYAKHFFVLVVLSNLPLATLCFTVGTLTRSVKIVYAITCAFYLVYGTWQMQVLKGMQPRWRVVLDPLMMNWGSDLSTVSPALVNQHAFGYGSDVLANRALVLLATLLCFGILCVRFSIAARPPGSESVIDQFGRASRRRASSRAKDVGFGSATVAKRRPIAETVALPRVRVLNSGYRAGLAQLFAAAGVEVRLLRAERSLVVVLPLAVAVCGIQVAYLGRVATAPHSATYAAATVAPLLLLVLGVAIFYTGEAMHRDRMVRIEPLLWSTPVPNAALLLSKTMAVLLVSLAVVGLGTLTAIVVQLLHGRGPIDPSPYAQTQAMILLPSAAFVLGASAAFNVVLRDKYLAYAMSIAVSGAMYFLLAGGHTHWSYNVVLYGRWTPANLSRHGPAHSMVMLHGLYVLGLAIVCFAVALLRFERRRSYLPSS